MLEQWLRGELTPVERLWGALAPAMAITAYFLATMALFALRSLLWGPQRDAEIDRRGGSPLVGMWLRHWFAWSMRPLERLLVSSGVGPNAITATSLVLSVASGATLAIGRFSLGGWLFLFAGICDYFDGRVARARGLAGPSGAAVDSFTDRYVEAVVFLGLTIYWRDRLPVLLLVQAALVGSFMVSYARARGEGLGFSVKVGTMQRTERVVTLGVAVAFSPLVELLVDPLRVHPPHRLAIASVALLAISTHATAVRRLLHVVRAARDGAEPPAVEVPSAAGRPQPAPVPSVHRGPR